MRRILLALTCFCILLASGTREQELNKGLADSNKRLVDKVMEMKQLNNKEMEEARKKVLEFLPTSQKEIEASEKWRSDASRTKKLTAVANSISSVWVSADQLSSGDCDDECKFQNSVAIVNTAATVLGTLAGFPEAGPMVESLTTIIGLFVHHPTKKSEFQTLYEDLTSHLDKKLDEQTLKMEDFIESKSARDGAIYWKSILSTRVQKVNMWVQQIQTKSPDEFLDLHKDSFNADTEEFQKIEECVGTFNVISEQLQNVKKMNDDDVIKGLTYFTYLITFYNVYASQSIQFLTLLMMKYPDVNGWHSWAKNKVTDFENIHKPNIETIVTHFYTEMSTRNWVTLNNPGTLGQSWRDRCFDMSDIIVSRQGEDKHLYCDKMYNEVVDAGACPYFDIDVAVECKNDWGKTLSFSKCSAKEGLICINRKKACPTYAQVEATATGTGDHKWRNELWDDKDQKNKDVTCDMGKLGQCGEGFPCQARVLGNPWFHMCLMTIKDPQLIASIANLVGHELASKFVDCPKWQEFDGDHQFSNGQGRRIATLSYDQDSYIEPPKVYYPAFTVNHEEKNDLVSGTDPSCFALNEVLAVPFAHRWEVFDDEKCISGCSFKNHKDGGYCGAQSESTGALDLVPCCIKRREDVKMTCPSATFLNRIPNSRIAPYRRNYNVTKVTVIEKSGTKRSFCPIGSCEVVGVDQMKCARKIPEYNEKPIYSRCQVDFWEDAHYQGKHYHFDQGQGSAPELKKVSSAKIADGCSMTVYDAANSQGKARTMIGYVPDFSKVWFDKSINLNDRMASFEFTNKNQNSCVASFYKDIVFKGSMMTVAGENPKLEQKWDNVISSVSVSPGCSVQVWKEPEYKGETHVYAGRRNTMNDAISSYKVKNFVCQVILFAEKDFGGMFWSYQTSQAFGGQFEWNDNVQSLKITPGCSIKLYSDEKYESFSNLIRHDTKDFIGLKPSSFKLIFDRENFCPTIKELLALPVKERYETWDKGCDGDTQDYATCRMPEPPTGYFCTQGPDRVGMNNYPCCTKPRWQVLELEGSYQTDWEIKSKEHWVDPVWS